MIPSTGYPPCETCGHLAAPRLNQAGHIMDHHYPGSPLCKLAAWGDEVRELDLMRVTSQLAGELGDRGVAAVYGPALREGLSGEGDINDWIALKAEQSATGGKRKPAVVTTNWAPRWAVVLSAAYGPWWSREKVAVFELAKGSEEVRDAILSVADLAGTEQEVRERVAAFCKTLGGRVGGSEA